MMKQTKDDILVVKQMSYEESNGKDKVEDLEGQIKEDIFLTIFGLKRQGKNVEEERINFQKRCKRVNVLSYEQQM